ncbi:hypothetical protein [Amycolatopsis sp. NPDC051102]|uniref:hypothetical protein n=1 Tax=Amycolatopsis sp. NPDC051102 TaxID=3155163 RepID=UPI0034357E99
MRSSFARGRWILPVLAVLCAGCQSASASVHYPGAIDACRLPGANLQAQLAPGTVEIPAGSLKTAETKVIPEDQPGDGTDVTGCKRVFARDLGGGKADPQDYRVVTIAVVRFTGSDAEQGATKASQLMTDALGDHSGVRLVTGVGDEAGFSEQWAAVRTGNVVLGVAIADGGTEAALIAPATLDNVQAAVTDMTSTLQRSFQG